MKKTIILAALAAICASAPAQTPEELIRADHNRAVGIYHHYETFGNLNDTPAPRGYKPFYISHYGRHGSRYHSSPGFFNRAIAVLEDWQKAGILTDKGGELLGDLKLYAREQNGLDGILTQTGSLEHRQIADRMYHRFPQVFRNRNCKDIQVCSSIFPRCLQSGANFMLSLESNAPGLRFHIYTGDRHMDYLCHTVSSAKMSSIFEGVRDSIMKAEFVPDRFIGTLATDIDKARKLCRGGDPLPFVGDVFYSGALCQNSEAELPDIYDKYFTEDELVIISHADNARWYGGFANSTECGDFRSRGIGVPLLKDILAKADEALESGSRIADLRFGHDTGLAPLFFLLETEESGGRTSIAKGSKNWWCFREMCMGSNIQIVFYRNRKDDVLVKILHNERETSIPAVPAFSGPYYRWEDLRAYFVKLTEN